MEEVFVTDSIIYVHTVIHEQFDCLSIFFTDGCLKQGSAVKRCIQISPSLMASFSWLSPLSTPGANSTCFSNCLFRSPWGVTARCGTKITSQLCIPGSCHNIFLMDTELGSLSKCAEANVRQRSAIFFSTQYYRVFLRFRKR